MRLLHLLRALVLLLFFVVLSSTGSIDDTSKSSSSPGDTFFNRALSLLNSGKQDSSLVYFDQAKTSYNIKGELNKAADCYYYLAWIRLQNGNDSLAGSVATEGIGFILKNKLNHPLLPNLYYIKGLSEMNRNDLTGAYQVITEMISKYGMTMADSLQSKACNKKGAIEYYRGDFFEAIKSFGVSLNYAEKAYGHQSIHVSDQLNNLGVMNFMLQRYDDALDYYTKSQEVLKSLKESHSEALAGIYTNIGLIFKAKNDLYNAVDFHKKAIELYLSDIEDGKQRIASAYLNLSVAYGAIGNFAEQLENINKSCEYAEKYKPVILPRVYFQYGTYYEETNNVPMAEKYFLMALNKAKEFFGEGIDLAYAYNNLGEFYAKHNIHRDVIVGYFNKALTYYIKNYGDKGQSQAFTLFNLGEYYNHNGRYNQALEYYQKSIMALSENFSNTDVYTVDTEGQSISDELMAEILQAKAGIFERLGRETSDPAKKKTYSEAAYHHYHQAIHVVDRMRYSNESEESRLFITGNQESTYLNCIRTAFELNASGAGNYFIEQAFAIADKSHAANLQTMLKEKEIARMKFSDTLLVQLNLCRKELSIYNEFILKEKTDESTDTAKLNLWTGKTNELLIKIKNLETEINRRHPAYQHLKDDRGGIERVHYIQKNLAVNECLLEYFVSDSLLFSFYVTQNRVIGKQFPIDSTFVNRIVDVLQFVKYPRISNADSTYFKKYKSAGYELYSLLIAPYDSLIRGKLLTIIPDAALTYMPFETLLTSKISGGNLNFKELPYLVKQNAIRYLYSGNLIKLDNNGKAAPVNELVAFAPEYNFKKTDYTGNKTGLVREVENPLENLPGSADEIKTAGKYFSLKVFKGTRATKDNFEKYIARYSMAHLAMHAIIDDNEPMASRLVFTPADSGNGYNNQLYIYETNTLNLNTDLLVLSACNTGAGKYRKGEGIISLTRGFVYSGVRSILMTLWSVNDESSATLTGDFYKYLAQNQLKDVALMNAKKEFIASSDIMHAHPYFWAGYVLIGDNSAVTAKHSSGHWPVILGLSVILVALALFFIMKYKR